MARRPERGGCFGILMFLIIVSSVFTLVQATLSLLERDLIMVPVSGLVFTVGWLGLGLGGLQLIFGIAIVAWRRWGVLGYILTTLGWHAHVTWVILQETSAAGVHPSLQDLAMPMGAAALVGPVLVLALTLPKWRYYTWSGPAAPEPDEPRAPSPPPPTPAAPFGGHASASAPRAASSSLYWKCPHCGVVLEKNKDTLEVFKLKGGAGMFGVATCASCGCGTPTSEVYGGDHDADKGPALTHLFIFREGSKPSDEAWYIGEVIKGLMLKVSDRTRIHLHSDASLSQEYAVMAALTHGLSSGDLDDAAFQDFHGKDGVKGMVLKVYGGAAPAPAPVAERKEDMKDSLAESLAAISAVAESAQHGNLDKANRLLDAAGTSIDAVKAALDAAESGEKDKVDDILGAIGDLHGTVDKHIKDERAADGSAEDVDAEVGKVRSVAGIEEKKPQRTSGPAFEVRGGDGAREKMAGIERYFTMEHPRSEMEVIMGTPASRPEYRVTASGEVARSSSHIQDMKIVTTAKMLQGGQVNIHDPQAVAAAAMKVITHYAGTPKVKQFFLMPYHVRTGMLVLGAELPKEEICKLYAGVENMLLEIYEDLPEAGQITDTAVERKIDQITDRIA